LTLSGLRSSGTLPRKIVLIIDAMRLADQGQKFWITGNGVWLTEYVRPEALRR
jgi:RNA:NAD 2'-phosphotransferase (TPT1/KptA family)